MLAQRFSACTLPSSPLGFAQSRVAWQESLLLLPLLLGVALCVLEVPKRSQFLFLKNNAPYGDITPTSGHLPVVLDRERQWEGSDKVDNLCQKELSAVSLRACQRRERHF